MPYGLSAYVVLFFGRGIRLRGDRKPRVQAFRKIEGASNNFASIVDNGRWNILLNNHQILTYYDGYMPLAQLPW
jgi:hypothetical protein